MAEPPAKRAKMANGHGAVGDWTPASWRSFPIEQQPEYDEPEKLAEVLEKIRYIRHILFPQAAQN